MSESTGEAVADKRFVRGRAAARDLPDLLQNLLVAELLRPAAAGPLWVVVPALADPPVVDNTAAGFTGLVPGWPAAWVRLSAVLLAVLRRGTAVHLVVPAGGPDPVAEALAEFAAEDLPLSVRTPTLFPAPLACLLGGGFRLDGLIDFDAAGPRAGEDGVTLYTNPADVARRADDLAAAWAEMVA